MPPRARAAKKAVATPEPEPVEAESSEAAEEPEPTPPDTPFRALPHRALHRADARDALRDTEFIPQSLPASFLVRARLATLHVDYDPHLWIRLPAAPLGPDAAAAWAAAHLQAHVTDTGLTPGTPEHDELRDRLAAVSTTHVTGHDAALMSVVASPLTTPGIHVRIDVQPDDAQTPTGEDFLSMSTMSLRGRASRPVWHPFADWPGALRFAYASRVPHPERPNRPNRVVRTHRPVLIEDHDAPVEDLYPTALAPLHLQVTAIHDDPAALTPVTSLAWRTRLRLTDGRLV